MWKFNSNKKTKHDTKWSWSFCTGAVTGCWRSPISWPIPPRPQQSLSRFPQQLRNKLLGDLRDARPHRHLLGGMLCWGMATVAGRSNSDWEDTALERTLPHLCSTVCVLLDDQGDTEKPWDYCAHETTQKCPIITFYVTAVHTASVYICSFCICFAYPNSAGTTLGTGFHHTSKETLKHNELKYLLYFFLSRSHPQQRQERIVFREWLYPSPL